jgi:hypothetical protein
MRAIKALILLFFSAIASATAILTSNISVESSIKFPVYILQKKEHKAEYWKELNKSRYSR